MSLQLDPLTPADLPDALRLSTEAGWNQVRADWERLLDLSPQGCIAGRLDGRAVGTATVASFGGEIHWIGMVLVEAALRGRGMGTRLLARSLDLARERGGGTIGLDASDLGRPVYLKQGFVDVAPIDRWSGVLRLPGPVAALAPAGPSRLEELSDLDRACCGTDRSALLAHLLGEPGVECAVVGRGRLAGFAFLRPGRQCGHIGPVIAREEGDFGVLLGDLARRAAGRPVVIDALRTASASRILEEAGLSVARRLTRMTLGAPRRVLMGESVRAAMSFEWG